MLDSTSNVLIIKPYDLASADGVSTFLMERLPRIAAEQTIAMHLFVPGKIINLDYAQKLEKAGVRVIEGNINWATDAKTQLQLRDVLKCIMSNSSFDVIHVNSASVILEYHSLSLAERHGIPVRIAHSHSLGAHQSPLKRIATSIYRAQICRLATHFFACSDAAGEYLFGAEKWHADGTLIPNGIDTEKYTYSPEIRTQIRQKMNCDNDVIIIGFIGRLVEPKNPHFITDLAIQLCSASKKTRFWVVGDGPYLAEMRERIDMSDLSQRVLFLGERDDISSLMQAMDGLVLPSLFEGLPQVLIEGQASGLPCFVSNRVPREAEVPGCSMRFIPLEKGASYWSSTILSSPLQRTEYAADNVRNAGYDVESSLNTLRMLYSAGSKTGI